MAENMVEFEQSNLNFIEQEILDMEKVLVFLYGQKSKVKGRLLALA